MSVKTKEISCLIEGSRRYHGGS